MSGQLWQFSAMDRLFFRDGRPFNMSETTWQESQFPPSGRTLQGAVRTAILQHLGADFAAFAKGEPCYNDAHGKPQSLREQMGDATSLGQLALSGPFVMKDGGYLFPAPLDLVRYKSGGYGLLTVNEAQTVDCDLGRVVLPHADAPGVKQLEGHCLTSSLMEAYLCTDIGAIQSPKRQDDGQANLWPLRAASHQAPGLIDVESKIGLERNDDTRTAEEGMLYSIAFVRPREGVSLGVGVGSLCPAIQPNDGRLQALGGEGKLAQITVKQMPSLPSMPQLTEKGGSVRFKLVLITPALLDRRGERWLPQGAEEQKTTSGATCWHITDESSSTSFTIVSACIGKRIKIGGWDIANNKPRPLTGYVPAGSVYFCRTDSSQLDNIKKLHGTKLGLDTEYGFGQVLVGTW